MYFVIFYRNNLIWNEIFFNIKILGNSMTFVWSGMFFLTNRDKLLFCEISSLLNKDYLICFKDITSQKFACTKTKDKSNIYSVKFIFWSTFSKIAWYIYCFRYTVHAILIFIFLYLFLYWVRNKWYYYCEHYYIFCNSYLKSDTLKVWN